jgi:DNA invertase Pin-like site-specific DNA recombinase
MSKEPEKQRRWVCYYRVSTQRQGESGLGLDAQRKAIETYLSVHSGSVLAAFTETESGKRAGNRPELQQALDLCRRKRATLVIAKLDRLARNVHFISGLLESGCNFVAVDQPTKDRFMLHLQAAFAEEESRRISLRTKEALAAAKLRGIVIGASGRDLAQRHKTAALNRARVIMPIIEAIQAAGFKGSRQIRDELNRRRVPSPGGAFWHLPTIHKTLQRIAFLKSARVSRYRPGRSG